MSDLSQLLVFVFIGFFGTSFLMFSIWLFFDGIKRALVEARRDAGIGKEVQS